MVQEIITYIIVLSAIGAAFYRLFKLIIQLANAKTKTASGKCGGCSSGCALHDLPVANTSFASAPSRILYNPLK